MNGQDQVAAIVFCAALEPQTIDEMETAFLNMNNDAENWPDPESRLGLAVIVVTSPAIEKPTEQEVSDALNIVVPL